MQNPSLLKLWQARLRRSKDFRKQLEPQWERLTNYYHLKDPDHTYRFVSFLKDYSDSIRARWVNGIFDGDSYFGLKGKSFQFDDAADKMEKLINDQNETNKVVSLLKRMMMPLSYLGHQEGVTYWDEQNKCPGVKSISLWDYYPEPLIADPTWRITKEKIKIRTLRALEEMGVVQDIDNIGVGSVQNQFGEEKDGNQALETARGIAPGSVTSPTNESEDYDREVEIYEGWDDEDKTVVTWENKTGEFIQVDEAYPFDHGTHPFFTLRPITEEGFYYGIPPVEALLEWNLELNENRYYKRFNMDLIMQGVWLGKRGSNIDWDRLKKKAICIADDVSENTIRRLNVENVLPHIENDEASIRMYGDREAHIFDPQRGGGEGAVTHTYKGLNLIVKEGNLLFSEQISFTQIDGIQPLVRKLISLNQQYLPGEVTIRDKNNEIVVNRQNIQGQLKISVTSAPGLADKEWAIQTISNLQAKYANSPLVNQHKMAEKEFKANDLDPEEMLLPQQQVDLLTENQQLKQKLGQVQAEIEKAKAQVEAEAINHSVKQPAKEEMYI